MRPAYGEVLTLQSPLYLDRRREGEEVFGGALGEPPAPRHGSDLTLLRAGAGRRRVSSSGPGLGGYHGWTDPQVTDGRP